MIVTSITITMEGLVWITNSMRGALEVMVTRSSMERSCQGWMSKNGTKEIDRISKPQCSDGQGVSPRKQYGKDPEEIHQYANVITESKTNSYK